jgi:3-hydroxyisobutyrate dehydrogenase-like beta-hydroxyacid dehydrogenase
MSGVGLIGLGVMGGGMAENILTAGIPLVAYDIDAAKLRRFASLGATLATSPADVARQVPRSICMVETTAQALSVVMGEDGIVSSAAPGHRVACASTIAPEAIQTMHAALAPRKIELIDAPVSGGGPGAKAGTLTVFAGGDSATVDAFRDVFDAVADNVFHLGKLGSGMAMKLINNMLIQTSSVAIAEAMVMGRKAGIDPQTIYDVVRVSTGYSVAFERRVPKMIARDFSPGGTLDISYKDQELQTAFAKQLGVPLFVANVTQQVYQMGRNLGLGKEDGSALIKLYEHLSGLSDLSPPAAKGAKD